MQEDNTDALKENADTNDSTDTSAIYFGDSKMQTKDEFEKSKEIDHTKEDAKLTSSDFDDFKSDDDGGEPGESLENKYGDPELNKGLEAQAKDEES